MGRKEKDCPASRKKYRKGIVFILLFVLIAVIVGAAGSSLTEAKWLAWEGLFWQIRIM